MTLPRLTPNQREVTLRLCSMARVGVKPDGEDRWVYDKDLGQRAALAHVYDKGYADRTLKHGPLGGERWYYRPTAEGWNVYAAYVERLNDGARAARLPTSMIDARIDRARRRGRIVRVYVGEHEYRGVPGPVERGDDGKLVLVFGQRRLLLNEISRVTD